MRFSVSWLAVMRFWLAVATGDLIWRQHRHGACTPAQRFLQASLALGGPTAGISIWARQRYTQTNSKRLVDIDDALLEEATTILGASTMKDAVNRSLESVVLAARRRRHAGSTTGHAGALTSTTRR